MNLLVLAYDAEGMETRSVYTFPAIYDTGAIDKVYVANVSADTRTPMPTAQFPRKLFCHPDLDDASLSSLSCICGDLVTDRCYQEVMPTMGGASSWGCAKVVLQVTMERPPCLCHWGPCNI